MRIENRIAFSDFGLIVESTRTVRFWKFVKTRDMTGAPQINSKTKIRSRHLAKASS